MTNLQLKVLPTLSPARVAPQRDKARVSSARYRMPPAVLPSQSRTPLGWARVCDTVDTLFGTCLEMLTI